MTGDLFTSSGITDEDGAAAYLAANMPVGRAPSVRTLRRWRRLLRGPSFRKEGRFVWYHRNDLDEWLLVENGGIMAA